MATYQQKCVIYSRKEMASRHYDYFDSPPTESLMQREAGFVSFDDRFQTIIGDEPSIKLIVKDDTEPFAHEAGVYIPETGDIFITSNHIRSDGKKKVKISRVRKTDEMEETEYCISQIDVEPEIYMANGAVNYRQGVLFCEQGSLTEPGGLTYLPVNSEPTTTKYTATNLISSYYGRWFNSVNDVVIHVDGSVWFTDPPYGYEQGIRPVPQLPAQTYCFHPSTGSIRAMEDSLKKPNGLCFSPDQKTLYITDTASVRGDTRCHGMYSPTGPASIYAFDVVSRNGGWFLTDKRLFAFADQGIPDGIKCDREGNVYSGCGDGLHVWAADGTLIGKIFVPGGCANFCFGKGGEVFLLNENKMWRAQFSSKVNGDLLGI